MHLKMNVRTSAMSLRYTATEVGTHFIISPNTVNMGLAVSNDILLDTAYGKVQSAPNDVYARSAKLLVLILGSNDGGYLWNPAVLRIRVFGKIKDQGC
jgi:hypothetical protein